MFFPQAVEKVFSLQPFLSAKEFLPVKTAKKEKRRRDAG